MKNNSNGSPLLTVRDLKVHFPIEKGLIFKKQVGAVRAVDGVSFDLMPGKTLGLVGESGCGKSTTARGILQLIRPTSGSVQLKGEELTELEGEDLRLARRNMQMIFQDPYASLSPRMTVGGIITEPLLNFGTLSRAERKERGVSLLEKVGLDPSFINRYPHEFSGGQRQRIGVARALALEPKVIIADEPVSALDVSIQAQIINLLMELQDELGLTYLFIAHDLAVVRHISDRVAVMYLGRIAELADSDQIYTEPLHPYTKALLSAVPIPDPGIERSRERIVLTGEIPSPTQPITGCKFHGRCPLKEPACEQVEPQTVEARPGHWVACHVVAREAGLEAQSMGEGKS